jgi:hypothetical protein
VRRSQNCLATKRREAAAGYPPAAMGCRTSRSAAGSGEGLYRRSGQRVIVQRSSAGLAVTISTPIRGCCGEGFSAMATTNWPSPASTPSRSLPFRQSTRTRSIASWLRNRSLRGSFCSRPTRWWRNMAGRCGRFEDIPHAPRRSLTAPKPRAARRHRVMANHAERACRPGGCRRIAARR